MYIICTYTSIYIYIYGHIYIYTYIYIHTDIHLYTCVHIHIHRHVYMYIHTYIHVCVYTYLHICKHVYIYTYIYVCIYIYIYTHTCIHIHVHMQIHVSLCVRVFGWVGPLQGGGSGTPKGQLRTWPGGATSAQLCCELMCARWCLLEPQDLPSPGHVPRGIRTNCHCHNEACGISLGRPSVSCTRLQEPSETSETVVERQTAQPVSLPKAKNI